MPAHRAAGLLPDVQLAAGRPLLTRALGGLVLLKAVDVPGPALLVLALAGGLLLAGRDRRPVWALLLGGVVLACALQPVELRRQHLVLLGFVALCALVARDATERRVLWRVQLSVLYGVAALAKLGEPFLSGAVLGASLPVALPDPVLVGLSAAVVVAEALLAVSPWVARWRRPALVGGALLHAGALLLAVTPLVGLRLVFFGGLAVVLLASSAGARGHAGHARRS